MRLTCTAAQHSITIVAVKLGFEHGALETDATCYKVTIPIALPVLNSSVSAEIFDARTEQLMSILSSCIGIGPHRMRGSVQTEMGAPKSNLTSVNIDVFLRYVKSPRQLSRVSSIVRLLSKASSPLYKRVHSTMLDTVVHWPEYSSTRGKLQISPPVLTVPPPVFSNMHRPPSSRRHATFSARLVPRAPARNTSNHSTRPSRLRKNNPSMPTGRGLKTKEALPLERLSRTTSTRGLPPQGNAFRRQDAAYSDGQPGNTAMDFFVRSHSNFMSSDNVIRSVSLSANQSQLAGRMSVFSIYSSHADYCRNSEDHTLQNIRAMLQPMVQEASQNRVTALYPLAISPTQYRGCAEPSAAHAAGKHYQKESAVVRPAGPWKRRSDSTGSWEGRPLTDSDRMPFSVEIVLFAANERDIVVLKVSPMFLKAGVVGITHLQTPRQTGLQVSTVPDRHAVPQELVGDRARTNKSERNIIIILAAAGVAVLASMIAVGVHCCSTHHRLVSHVQQQEAFAFPCYHSHLLPLAHPHQHSCHNHSLLHALPHFEGPRQTQHKEYRPLQQSRLWGLYERDSSVGLT